MATNNAESETERQDLMESLFEGNIGNDNWPVALTVDAGSNPATLVSRMIVVWETTGGGDQ